MQPPAAQADALPAQVQTPQQRRGSPNAGSLLHMLAGSSRRGQPAAQFVAGLPRRTVPAQSGRRLRACRPRQFQRSRPAAQAETIPSVGEPRTPCGSPNAGACCTCCGGPGGGAAAAADRLVASLPRRYRPA